MTSASGETTDKSAIPFWHATLFWLKLGLVSFGGPAGQIAIMHQELVEKRHWISEHRFLHALNFCMLLPGPEAQQLATYIGWLMHKTWGGLVAGILFVLPSLFILISLAWIYIAYADVPAVAGVFYGIKPAVTAIVIYAAYRIGIRALNNMVLLAIAAASFIAIFVLKLAFPVIVVAAAITGFIGGRLLPAKFNRDAAQQVNRKSYGPAIIDDQTALPEHAQFSLQKLFKVVVIAVALWCLPMALLNISLGWDHTLTQMGWFFTKAALILSAPVAFMIPGFIYYNLAEEGINLVFPDITRVEKELFKIAVFATNFFWAGCEFFFVLLFFVYRLYFWGIIFSYFVTANIFKFFL